MTHLQLPFLFIISCNYHVFELMMHPKKSVKSFVKNSENSAHQKVSVVKLPTRVSGKQLLDAFLFT